MPSAFQQKQINELHSTLNREKLTAVVERNRVKLAENAVAEKDKEVNELVTRLMQYERGIILVNNRCQSTLLSSAKTIKNEQFILLK